MAATTVRQPELRQMVASQGHPQSVKPHAKEWQWRVLTNYLTAQQSQPFCPPPVTPRRQLNKIRASLPEAVAWNSSGLHSVKPVRP
ncbi:hypothetical protein WJX82_000622 [Trebouxia sp. C0006]